MNEPFIYIIVLNWNQAALTLQCLHSLERLNYTNYTVTVVDNGSTDNSAELLKSHFPHIHVLSLGENLGFARGNNIGLDFAVTANPQWILFLNNDTEVDPDLLRAFADGINRYQSGRIFGPKIYFGDKRTQIWYAGGEIRMDLGRIRHRGIREVDQGQYDISGVTGFVTGCCLLIHHELIRELKGFDPKYLMYAEDVDLCYRAREAGSECYYIPTAKVWHYVSSSLGGVTSVRKVLLKLRSNLRFLVRYAKAYHWPSIIGYQLWYHLVEGPSTYLRTRRS